MNNSLRGALLSGLVFPGLGQVILKHYKRGVVLMIVVLACVSVVVVKAVQQALAILDQIQFDGGAISMSTISSAAHQASAASDSHLISFSLLFIVFCWIFGIVDAYRIGKRRDVEGSSAVSVSHIDGN